MLAVDADLEAAAIGRDEDQAFDFIFEFGDEFFGQTDRFGFVVSNLAVDDFDFHYFPSFAPSHKFRSFTCSGVAFGFSTKFQRSS